MNMLHADRADRRPTAVQAVMLGGVFDGVKHGA
jgi:hypothetical protein